MSVLCLLFFSFGIAHALEIKPEYYPRVPMVPAITEKSKLGDFVAYFFGLGTMLAGAIAVIALAVAGVKLIIFSSNPEGRKDAIDSIKGALIGLVLTMASVVIIRTINLDLASPTLEPLPGVEGIFYTNGTEQKSAPRSEVNTANIPAGFTALEYVCKDSSAPTLFVWRYRLQNLDPTGGVTVSTLSCEKPDLSLSGAGSFKMEYDTVGVYYFQDINCNGYMSTVNPGNQNSIEPTFSSGGIKSVWIHNDPANNLYYGIIFHQSQDVKGTDRCTEPLYITKKEGCVNVGAGFANGIHSATIFRWNKDNYASSGDGIVLYSEPFGYKSDKINKEGVLTIKPDAIKDKKEMSLYDPISGKKGSSELDFDYTDKNVDIEYEMYCGTFNDCPGSIDVKGSYLVAFFSEKVNNGDRDPVPVCAVYEKSVENIKAEEFLMGYGIDKLVIFPTK